MVTLYFTYYLNGDVKCSITELNIEFKLIGTIKENIFNVILCGIQIHNHHVQSGTFQLCYGVVKAKKLKRNAWDVSPIAYYNIE